MAKIKFENGTVVNFDGEPTPQDIEEISQSIELTPESKQQTLQQMAETSPVIQQSPEPRKISNEEMRASFMENAGANIGGTIGSVAGALSKYPPLAVPFAVAGGYAGSIVQSGIEAAKDPNQDFDWSEANYKALQDAKFQGATEVLGAGASLAAKGLLKGTGALSKSAKNYGREWIAKKLESKVIPEAAEMQGRLFDAAGNLLPAGQAADKTLTVGQITQSGTVKFLEDISSGVLGGGKIKEARKIQTKLYEEGILPKAKGKITAGARPSPETIAAPVQVVNPIQKAGTKTPEQLGLDVAEKVNIQHDIFKKMANDVYQEDLIPQVKNVYQGKNIVDLGGLNKEAIDVIERSQQFGNIASNENSIKLWNKIKDVSKLPDKTANLSPEAQDIMAIAGVKTSGGQPAMSLESVIERFKGDPKYANAIKELTQQETTRKIPVEDAIELYQLINAEGGSVFKETVSATEKARQKAALAKIQDSLKSAIENATKDNPEIYEKFLGANKWYSEGAKKFEPQIAQAMLNDFKNHPADVMKMVESDNAATTIGYAKNALGDSGDEVVNGIKDTYVQELYNNSTVLDKATNTYITDHIKIQKAIQELNPEVKKLLFKGDELKAINKSISMAEARTRVKSAITNPVFIGDVVDTPEGTIKFINSQSAADDLMYIKNTLPKDESDDAMREIGNRWIEGLLESKKYKAFDPVTNSYLTNVDKIQKAIDGIAPAVEKILFKDRGADLKLFKDVVRQGLIQEAPSSVGRLGKYAVISRQVVGAMGLLYGAQRMAQGKRASGSAYGTSGLMLLFGPRAYSKIVTDPKLVEMLLKIKSPKLIDAATRESSMRKLYNALVTEPAISAEVRLVNMVRGAKEVNNVMPMTTIPSDTARQEMLKQY